MSSPPTKVSTGSPFVKINSCDLVNCNRFMDALVNFLNEANVSMKEVKQKAGRSLECALVPMNCEEKEEKMNTIISTLSQKCQMELAKAATGTKKRVDLVEPGTSSGKSRTPRLPTSAVQYGPYLGTVQSVPKGRSGGTDDCPGPLCFGGKSTQSY